MRPLLRDGAWARGLSRTPQSVQRQCHHFLRPFPDHTRTRGDCRTVVSGKQDGHPRRQDERSEVGLPDKHRVVHREHAGHPLPLYHHGQGEDESLCLLQCSRGYPEAGCRASSGEGPFRQAGLLCRPDARGHNRNKFILCSLLQSFLRRVQGQARVGQASCQRNRQLQRLGHHRLDGHNRQEPGSQHPPQHVLRPGGQCRSRSSQPGLCQCLRVSPQLRDGLQSPDSEVLCRGRASRHDETHLPGIEVLLLSAVRDHPAASARTRSGARHLARRHP